MSYTPPPPPPDEGGNGETPGPPPESTPPGYGAPPPPPPGYGSQPPPPPGYGGPGYGGPAYGGGPGYGGPPRNSSKAVGSLVVGLVSLPLGFCCAFIGLVGLAAVFMGRSAQEEIRNSNGALTGEGMAKAGFVLGIIGSAIGVIMTIINIGLIMNGDTTFNFNSN